MMIRSSFNATYYKNIGLFGPNGKPKMYQTINNKTQNIANATV